MRSPGTHLVLLATVAVAILASPALLADAQGLETLHPTLDVIARELFTSAIPSGQVDCPAAAAISPELPDLSSSIFAPEPTSLARCAQCNPAVCATQQPCGVCDGCKCLPAC